MPVDRLCQPWVYC